MSDPKPNDAFVWVQEPWGRALRCTGLRARHLFTTSDVTLRGDAGEWEAVGASLGVPRDRLLLIRQVHGTQVAVARRGATRAWTVPEADVIVTDDPDIAIGVRVADCAPVLLIDTKRQVAGAAHAGWRGTAAGASAAAVRAMRETFSSRPADIIAAVGPCLGSCCGEVGPEVVDAFRAAGRTSAEIDRWFTTGPTARPYLDLEQANRDQLASAGVPPESIFTSGLCTKTNHARFHSYRAAREQAGRLLAAIRIDASVG